MQELSSEGIIKFSGSVDPGSQDNETEQINFADFPTLVNNDNENSMTEEEIRDILFEAGYSTEDINQVLDSRPQISSGDSADSTIGSGVEACAENAHDMLREIRIKHTNKIVIGTLNINSLASKFEQLKEIIGRNLDILTIQEHEDTAVTSYYDKSVRNYSCR